MSDKRILCRCEDVTEHELRRAFVEGFRDFESLKRYTGVGTGICQGKGCLGECAQILAELRGVPPAEIPLTTIRPPMEPLTFADLAALEIPPAPEAEAGGGPAAAPAGEPPAGSAGTP